jgi:predicted metal-binding transcription factor (methanogenesis marker protein 9)
MNKIKLKTEEYISLYAELAERRLEAFEFAEYRQEEGVDVFVKDTNGDIIHSEWASDQFVEECNVIEEILELHGIIQE